MNPSSAISVRQLNFYVKALIEGNVKLASLAVAGEVSNFKRHFSSGHCYFTLKDDTATVKCVMFKGAALRCLFDITDGLNVICIGRVSLYEKDGTYQFYVDSMQPDGVGAKALALEQLKKKLEIEGMFDLSTKRKLNRFPKKIAVVTSNSGAALQDIINVISRRFPFCELVVAPVSVQGQNAVSDIVSMLEMVYKLNDVDTVIIGRGGGSSEDLDAFNSEEVARKVYESPFPVISAVGHETDFTVCDLVADMRAPTPSAAAELAVADYESLLNKKDSLMKRISSLLSNKYSLGYEKFRSVCNRIPFSKPHFLIENRILLADNLFNTINTLFLQKVKDDEKTFSKLLYKLEALSPLKCLARGYSVVSFEDKLVTDSSCVEVGQTVTVRLSKGKLICNVTDKE